VSLGRLVPERADGAVGGTLPASLPGLVSELLDDLPGNPTRTVDPGVVVRNLRRPLGDEERFVDFRDAAFASGPPYAPQAAGIALGAPPLALVYVARLANLAVSAALIWWALTLLPARRGPSRLGTADPAHWPRPRAAHGQRRGSLLDEAAVLPARRAGLPDPADRFRGGERWRRLAWVFAAVVAALTIASWGAYQMDLPQRPGAERVLRDALLEPGRVARLFVNDVLQHGLRYLAQAIGAQLGWLDTRVPWWAVSLYGAMLAVLGALDADPAVAPTRWQRVTLGVVVVTALVAMVASQYAVFTPYRAALIEGVQGRYFLPLAPAAALLIQSRRGAGRVELDRYAGWVAAPVEIGLAAALVAAARRYYG
jgi:hypothetical protein